MKWFVNLSTRGKLSAGFGIVLVSLMAVIVISVFMMKSLMDTQIRIRDTEINNVIDYMTLEGNINKNRNTLLRMMMAKDSSALELLQNGLTDTKKESDEIMERLSSRVQTDPMPQKKFDDLRDARNEFNRIRDEMIIPFIHKGEKKKTEHAFELGNEQYEKLKLLCYELSEIAKSNVRSAVNTAISSFTNAVLGIIILGILALLISFLMIIFMNKTISDPINQISAAAIKIGEGEIDTSVSFGERTDEIGKMAQSFNNMTESLRKLAQIADNIAEGDLTSTIKPRSKKDSLVISFGIMSENLKGLVMEIKKGTLEVQDSMLEILGITKEFIISASDAEKTKNFQIASQKMEDVTTRLNTLIKQIKL